MSDKIYSFNFLGFKFTFCAKTINKLVMLSIRLLQLTHN